MSILLHYNFVDLNEDRYNQGAARERRNNACFSFELCAQPPLKFCIVWFLKYLSTHRDQASKKSFCRLLHLKGLLDLKFPQFVLHCQRPNGAKFISTCATRCHYFKGHSVSLYYFLSKDRPTLFAISETIRNCLKYLIEIYRLPLVFKQVCFFLNEEIRIMQLNCAT